MSKIVEQRLRELAERWQLPQAAPGQLARLLELVAAEPTSITTVRDPEQGVELHVADALAGLAAPELRTAGPVADLGSGGGFPGLALAAALPGASFHLVESVGKKCAFVRAAATELGLTNVEVVHARAEEWHAGLGRQDVVTARALAPLSVLVEYAAPLLREGGALLAWKGVPSALEEADGAAAARVLGMQLDRVEDVDAAVPGADRRRLYLYLKVGATPDAYPRRAGMARKRPLQASS